jgi:hypothetical protein
MTVVRGLYITIVSAVAFAAAGATIGYALGTYEPDYYRVVFQMPPDLDADPAHVGLALGLSQGLVAGLVTGLVIVLCVTWYRSRTTAP